MALHPTILLILTGLTGVHSVITLSTVSVKAGDSITIPCLYDSKYKDNVKYLCGGKDWNSCSYLVKTDKPDTSGKFSITDYKSQRIFIVTIKHELNDMDTDFWCIVEIDYGKDDGALFHLSVTSGLPGLYVEKQEISGFIGDSITISCYHSTAGEMSWCKLGRSCVTGQWGAIDGTNVTIDSKVHNVYLVSMSGLMKESSGWYFCNKEPLKMPVHVTVTEKTTTTLATTKWITGGQTHHRSMSLIICLSLLVIVLLALFIWFMLKKHKENKSETAAITTVTAEAEVTYCDVKHQIKPSAKAEAQDTDVTYSM
ncbi:polymeric immunoglobulin receptor-like [Paralichthys olivaceus]|uniref:polymeric immunoglobulin receptor-like n=1 Tax=Paralichthys olivaceus TaxID=8255 RepID=UPI003753134C